MNKPVQAATITDVAQRARVSIKTVSRVVNREPGVHEETRAAVLKVVAELNYRPKQSARSLAGARSFLIGLLYYDPSAAFIGGVQQGATHRCRDAGYHLVVESLESDAGDIGTQLDHMVSALRPDGMILTPPVCDNPTVLDALQAARIPCVLISPDAHVHHLSQVRMDDVLAAEELTNLLISLGHTRIGFIKGAADQSASGLRLQGFLQAMKAHDLSVESDLIYQGNFTFPSGVEGAHHLLSRRSPPTAVFASNDDMALGVLSTAQRLGLSVPGDLSIVGFDDSPAASLVWPPLTTVRQPLAEMAAAAVDLLISREARPTDPGAEGQAAPAALRVIGHELIVRASTAAPQRRSVSRA
ncbi:LacI family DNA-binding transcriptional regulator [Ideonella sp.]|uniref:LacI family DNA-binding transcriptional regulator n=1 Tax=Ideonella sp. TaxID=1929293 RepID=UPI003BB7BF9B